MQATKSIDIVLKMCNGMEIVKQEENTKLQYDIFNRKKTKLILLKNYVKFTKKKIQKNTQ